MDLGILWLCVTLDRVGTEAPVVCWPVAAQQRCADAISDWQRRAQSWAERVGIPDKHYPFSLCGPNRSISSQLNVVNFP